MTHKSVNWVAEIAILAGLVVPLVDVYPLFIGCGVVSVRYETWCGNLQSLSTTTSSQKQCFEESRLELNEGSRFTKMKEISWTPVTMMSSSGMSVNN